MMRLSRNGHWVVVAFFVLLAFASYTWHNTFPYFYHSDEESKSLQLLYGYYNFWHPLLMLNGTRFVSYLLDLSKDPQMFTVIGRTLSAIFGAVAVGAFVRLSLVRLGFVSGILTGIFLLCLPQLFETGHYCKEDPALLMGFALTLSALDGFARNPSTRGVLTTGFSVGLTISAKYSGVVLLPLALVSILLLGKSWKWALIYLTTVAVCVILLNWQWIFDAPQLFSGIAKESVMLACGHDGVGGSLPHSQYWQMLWNQHGLPLLLVALLGWIGRFYEDRRLTMEVVLGLGLFFVITLMSFSPKISERYLLPFMAIILYLASAGFSWVGSKLPTRIRPIMFCVFVPFILLHQFGLMKRAVNDFRGDSRAELAAWMKIHLSPEDKICYSLWTRLPGYYQGAYEAKAEPLDYVADYGSIPEIKKMGYGWVVVADVEKERFFHNDQTGTQSREKVFEERRSFYSSLVTEADLVWKSQPGFIYILHPGLSLYRLR